MTTPLKLSLAGVAHLVWADRAAFEGDRELRELAAELAGVLDALSGVAYTNPEESVPLRLRHIQRLAGVEGRRTDTQREGDESDHTHRE